MNADWKKLFTKKANTITVNCKICSKSFKDERGLHVHVTKVHRKCKHCEDKDEVPEEKKEENHEVVECAKKRRRYSTKFKKNLLSKLENRTAKERTEILQKCKVPAKTAEKWQSPAKKREILHGAVVHPFRKKIISKKTKKPKK